jgi:hypothetical protein
MISKQVRNIYTSLGGSKTIAIQAMKDTGTLSIVAALGMRLQVKVGDQGLGSGMHG